MGNLFPTPIPKTDPPSLRKPLRLLLLRLLGLAFNTPAQPHPVNRRVLLIRPDHLGDLLFVTPALRTLRAQMPDAHVTLLVGPWGKPVVERSPYVDEVQTLAFPGFTRRPKGSPLAPYTRLWEAARHLRMQDFDTAVILRFDHWWGALLAALARIPRRIGYTVPEVRPFVNDGLPYLSGRHEVAQNLRLIAHLAAAPEPEASPQQFPLEFPITDADRQWADAFLRAQGVMPGERLAVLQPGSGAPVKLWRAEGFARVAEALHARWGLKVLMAGADEHALVERIRAQARAPLISAVGQTTLPQLAAIFARSAIAVGTDSGPMHLAVAMGTPTVHLFGPVSARAFGPWGDPARHRVLTSGLACIACNRLDYTEAELPAHPCVPLIAEQQVLSAVESLIG